MSKLLDTGFIEVELKDLFLDPNNPRLALPDEPGYENHEILFNRENHNKIYETVINGNHEIKGGLVNTILGVGWEDVNSIIVWQPDGIEGKYLVTEGNRRVTALNYIHSEVYPKAKKIYEKAKESSVPGAQEDLAKYKEDAEKAETVFNQTKKLYVKKMTAKNANDLQRDLPPLLSTIHLSGPKDWGLFEQSKFVYETYINFWRSKFGPLSDSNVLTWDDEIERKTMANCNIKTLGQTRQALRSYTWFANFKFVYSEDLPAGEEFSNTDYFLFDQINKSKWFREEV